MPAKTAKQAEFMRAVAHNPEFAHKVGVPQSVGREFEHVRKDATPELCAGILIRGPGPKYLLLHKPDEGRWIEPGGHLKPGETPLDAALRETREEIGGVAFGVPRPLARTAADGVDYTTYVAEADRLAKPAINDKHDGWGWFAPDALPDDTHPQVAALIALLEGPEDAIAEAMAAGPLLSPQPLEQSWLFDLRITGTGTAYRRKLDEFVYRPPDNFLTSRFVRRCNGLPVVYEHPNRGTVSAHDRVVGTIVLPYIRGSEVRGIARIFDLAVVRAMLTDHASTSPAVIFHERDATSVALRDGSMLLIEGTPARLDHLAICPEGVWDKNQAPAGVNLSSRDAMETR